MDTREQPSKLIVVRTDRTNYATWVVAAPRGFISRIEGKQCAGVNSSACFLTQNFYSQKPVEQLRKLALLVLDHAATGYKLIEQSPWCDSYCYRFLLYKAVNPPLPTQSHVSAMAASRREERYRRVLQIGGAVIQVDIRIGQGSLRNEDIVAWVLRAKETVAVSYGRFPVQRARAIVSQNEDKDESIHGTTWGDVQGVQDLSRILLGSDVTKADLEEDWTMTHELVHMALSSLPDESHWLEEGIATYVEPIARAQANQFPIEQV